MPTTLTKYTDDELRRLAEKAEQRGHYMSHEQRASIHLDARREVRKALRRYRNSSVVGFVILLAGLFAVRAADLNSTTQSREAVARSGNAVAITGCNRHFRTQAIQRAVLVKNFDLTRKRAELLVSLPDCREVADDVTTNPEAVKSPPRPLRPSDEPRILREYQESVGD